MMADKIYSIDEIRNVIQPIAQRYGVERVALFGSYARGEAKATSDIDLRIDSGEIRDYFKLSGFHQDLEEALQRSVDVLTTGALDEKFLNRIRGEEVNLYGQ
jgi:Predicted nucleotidyltransferases